MSLGASLGMETTAEGVETEEQLEILRAEGCTQAQDYLFSPALPAKDLPALLQRLNSSTTGRRAKPRRVAAGTA